MDYDENDDHDYITLETWFIYDEDNGDAQASTRFEFADDSSTFGFTGDLYDDIIALGVSSNAALVKDTEEYVLKYSKYGFNGRYDSYGNPIYEWSNISKTDDDFDYDDAGGSYFNVNYPSMNTERYKYIKTIRGYAKSEVVHRGSSWNNEMYDVYSYYLHAEKDIHWSGAISIPLGGSLAFEYEDNATKITGHCQERIDD